MAKRSDLTNTWASSDAAFVVDPEVDVDHPGGEGGPGKTARGWTVETEPQEWENFILNLHESRLKAVAQNGRLPWDADVFYKLGSLTTYAGVNYVSISASNKNKNPATQTANWSPVKFTTAAGYLATVADMQSKFTAHTVPGQNSHADDIVAIGGSYKATIDAQVKFVNDSIVTHAARMDNPHRDTAIGTGTIPATGGNFNGRINYTQNLSIGTDCELMTNISTFVAFRSFSGAIGVGVADYHNGGRWQHIFTTLSFTLIDPLYNPTFTMPRPDLHFPLTSNIVAAEPTGSLIFSRPSTLSFTNRSATVVTAAINAPAFEASGMKLSADTSLIVSAPGLFGCRDGCISYALNNVVFVKDVQFTNSQLTSYFGTAGNIKNFRVWSQRLTPRQKLRIPR